MNKFTFALVILIGFLVVSRFIAEAGIKKLSTEQKGRLVETMSPFRKFGLILWVVLAALAYDKPMYFIVGVILYIVIHQGLMHWQIKKLSLPSTYAKYSLVTSAVMIFGICVYSYIMMTPK